MLAKQIVKNCKKYKHKSSQEHLAYKTICTSMFVFNTNRNYGMYSVSVTSYYV